MKQDPVQQVLLRRGRFTPRLSGVCAAAVLVWAAGCGTKGPDVQFVEGRVTLDGTPLANATVGPQARWSPGGGKWQFTADAGMTVLRRLEYARNGRQVADLAPGNVPYARLGLQRLF
jgi:hypothetical protein